MLNNDLAAAYTAVADIEPDDEAGMVAKAHALAAIVQADALDRLATTLGQLGPLLDLVPDVAWIARQEIDADLANPDDR